MANCGKTPIEQIPDAVSSGDLTGSARNTGKKAGKVLAQASDSVSSSAAAAAESIQKAALPQKAAGLLQSLGGAAQDARTAASSNGFNINIDPRDLPRILRGATLLATGAGTLFAPGSVLDASRSQPGSTNDIAAETRKGIDSAADATQQRIKDLVDLARDGLSLLSDSLTSGLDSLSSSIDSAEKVVNSALDDTEGNLKGATKDLAKQAKNALPKEKKGGGSFRFLLFGLLVGGLIAFIQSPFSGPVGERINGLRRDLGLGGSEDDSQYWPSAPQNNASPSTATEATTSTSSTSSSTSAGGTTISNGAAPAADPSSSSSTSADA